MKILIDKLIQDLEEKGILKNEEIASVAAGLNDYLDSKEEIIKILSEYSVTEDVDNKQDLVNEMILEFELHLLPHIQDIIKHLKTNVGFYKEK